MSLFKAVEYSKHSYPQRYATFKYLVDNFHLIDALHYPVKALDVGCATGENTRLLTYFNNIQQVVAFDVDTEMVTYAECFNGDKKIHFTAADVQNVATWPKPNQNEFDLVTSFHVLHWAEDQQRALENIHRSMKPNGVFLARLLGKLVANDLLDFVNKSEKWSKYAVSYLIRPQPWMKEEDPAKYYENVLKKVGFSIVSCKNETETMKMSKEDASDYLKMTRLHRFKIPMENYEEFCDECFTFFFKNQRNEEDNTYNMIYHCIDVVARR